MTEVTARPELVAVAPRDVTADELAGLDRLRAALAAAVDRTEPRAISWLWDRTLDASRGGPPPAGFVESVAAAVGDLLAVHVPTVRWSVWPGPTGPTLGVASAVRPHAPVLPFLDAQERWSAGARGWVVDYLARAALHLAAAVPTPRAAPEGAGAPGAPVAGGLPAAPGDEAAPAPAGLTATPDDEVAAASRARVPLPTRTPVSPPAAPADLPLAAPAPVPASVAPAPTPAAPPPDVPLEDFARDTLDHALRLLHETGAFDREALVLLVGAGGRRDAQTCPGDGVEALTKAFAAVRESGARRAAVTWVERHPSYLPGPPQRFPAVVVDAWDAGAEGLRVAHRFVDDLLGTDPMGDPLVVGPVPPLL